MRHAWMKRNILEPILRINTSYVQAAQVEPGRGSATRAAKRVPTRTTPIVVIEVCAPVGTAFLMR